MHLNVSLLVKLNIYHSYKATEEMNEGVTIIFSKNPRKGPPHLSYIPRTCSEYPRCSLVLGSTQQHTVHLPVLNTGPGLSSSFSTSVCTRETLGSSYWITSLERRNPHPRFIYTQYGGI